MIDYNKYINNKCHAIECGITAYDKSGEMFSEPSEYIIFDKDFANKEFGKMIDNINDININKEKIIDKFMNEYVDSLTTQDILKKIYSDIEFCINLKKYQSIILHFSYDDIAIKEKYDKYIKLGILQPPCVETLFQHILESFGFSVNGVLYANNELSCNINVASNKFYHDPGDWEGKYGITVDPVTDALFISKGANEKEKFELAKKYKYY